MRSDNEVELSFVTSFEVGRLPHGDILFRINFSENAEMPETDRSETAAYVVSRATALEFARALLQKASQFGH